MLLICIVGCRKRFSAWYSKIAPVCVTNIGEKFDCVRNVSCRPNNNVDIENRLCSEAGNGRAATCSTARATLPKALETALLTRSNWTAQSGSYSNISTGLGTTITFVQSTSNLLNIFDCDFFPDLIDVTVRNSAVAAVLENQRHVGAHVNWNH